MRLLRVALVLAFGLATAGPEAHQCPVHDQHLAAHHDGSAGNHQHGNHQQKGHCTCPQACCLTGVTVALPAVVVGWTVPKPTTYRPVPVVSYSALPSSPEHSRPFALAPPRALA